MGEVNVSEAKPTELAEDHLSTEREVELEEELESKENINIYSTNVDQTYYEVELPELSEAERELMEEVRERAIDRIDIDPRNITDYQERENVFLGKIKDMFKQGGLAEDISEKKLDQMARMIVRDMIGFGLLDIFLEDDDLEDILVPSTKKPTYVYHRDYGMCITNVVFKDEDELLRQIEKIARHVGRRIDQQNPLLDAILPDGSRVNATIPPISLDGPTLSIRKFRRDPLTIVDLINSGTLNSDVAAFLWLATEGFGVSPSNILFAGGTACGKTTTMNAVSSFVPPRERMISIEDTAELNLPHEHWIRLETRLPNVEGRGEITMDDLVKNALRMRPDRIVVGEVRGPEAKTMFTGMNTGHDGCMGTIHSNNAMETITRLTENPMNVPEMMISALDAIVMQQRIQRHGEGSTRRITEIAEVSGMEDGKPQLSRVYKWNPKEDTLEATGVPSTIKKSIADFAGVGGREIEKEIKRRAAILEWMKEEDIRDIEKVGKIIHKYYKNPQKFMERITS
jgi:flagellar protein FlaI